MAAARGRGGGRPPAGAGGDPSPGAPDPGLPDPGFPDQGFPDPGQGAPDPLAPDGPPSPDSGPADSRPGAFGPSDPAGARGRPPGDASPGAASRADEDDEAAAAAEASAKSRRRRRLAVFAGAGGGLLAALVALGVLLFTGGPEAPPGPDPDALYSARLGELHAWVQGSEAVKPPPRPAFLTEMRLAGGRAQILAQAVEDFIRGDYQPALDGFVRAARDLPENPDALALEASANLRLLNYGQAKSLYVRALDLRKGRTPGLSEAADRLGLALCLFHEPDPDASLREASLAWNLRRDRLGPTDAETLAALNVMATSLIALSRTAVAGDILLEAVGAALDEGRKPDDPSLVDSVSILALAFEAQGRLDELSALFGPRPDPAGAEGAAAASAGASPGASPGSSPGTSPGPAAGTSPVPPGSPAAPPDLWEDPEPAPPPRSPVDLAEAREVLARLSAERPDSGVLPVLALAMIDELVPRSGPPCSGALPAEPMDELQRLCEILALGYARAGQPAEAVRILENLSAQAPPAAGAPREGRLRVEETLAALKTRAGDPAGAEAALRRALALIDYRGQEAGDLIALFSLRLADNLLAQGRPPIEAELELMSGLTRLEGLSSRSELERRPMTALLYLRLGLLLRTMSRGSDSRDFLRRAERAVKAGRAAHPEASAWYDGLADLIARAGRAGAGVAAKIDLSALYGLPAAPGPSARTPGEPEVMRLELAALKTLGRTAEFRPMIEAAVNWAASTDGRGGRLHRRYQSLFLKFLEESGDVESLLSALDDLAENHGLPPGREAVALKTSALRYRARILADHGRTAEAAEALGDARNLLLGQPGFEDRLREVEIDLQRMGAGAPGR